MRARDAGYLYGGADLAPGSFLRRAADRLDSDDVVEVRAPRRVALLLWQFSGARLATYDDPRLEGNDLRIRYRDLAAAWNERMAGAGFEADHLIVGMGEVPPGVEPLEQGRFAGSAWALLRRPSGH
jgi:hypothetical protein